MSYQRAIEAISLKKTDRIPHFESLDHPGYIQKLTGLDPFQNPRKAYVQAYEKLDIDWIFGFPTSQKPVRRFAEDESVRRDTNEIVKTNWGVTGSTWNIKRQFFSVEEVLSYDPFRDKRGVHLPEDIGAYIAGDLVSEEFNEWVIKIEKKNQEIMESSCLVKTSYYTTLFMFPIMIFGWDLFLESAALEPKRFAEVMERFAQVSIRNVKRWAQEDMPVFYSHDDLAGTNGPIFSPSWYRENIFPRYKEIWKSIKDKGVKIIFESDGDYTCFLDDLVAAGADGFVIKPEMDLAVIAEKYGKSKIIVGNIDTRILTFGKPPDVVAEVKRCVAQAGNCPGYFLRTSGDIPQNIPLENVTIFFEACRKYAVK